MRLLTFGVLRERLCGLDETVELLEGATVGQLIEILRGRTSNDSMDKEADEGLWRSLAVAVNREYSSLAVVLRDGDEVALLPPVSGGCCAHGEKRASLAKTALAMLARGIRRAKGSLHECCVDGLREEDDAD
ncbi:MAG: MoaD/ThiS family protein [Acidobacteriaceae bacterium]